MMTLRSRVLRPVFFRDHRAESAIEFGFVFPIVLTLFAGTVEYTRYAMWARQLSQLADTAAELISTNTTTVRDADVDFAWDSALAIIPDAVAQAKTAGVQWREVVRLRVSSLTMTPNDPSCRVTGVCGVDVTVDWSAGDPKLARPCNTKLAQVADDTVPAPDRVRRSINVVPSAIVVDVTADYVPLIGMGSIGVTTASRSAYYVPRTQASIAYEPSSSKSTFGYVCS